MNKYIKISIGAVSALMLCLSTVPAFAEGASGSGSEVPEVKTTTRNAASREVAETESEAHTTAASPKSETQKTEAKQRACTNKQNALNNITKRISERGQRQINTFDKIAQRTETFYKDKNLNVANYDTLVATVNEKKAAAQATVDKIAADKASFKCDGTDQPKVMADGFKADLKAETAALKDYKTSLKNLIVAVKSAHSTDASPTTGGDQ